MPEQQPQSQAQQQDNSQPPQGTPTSSTPHNTELYRIRAVWFIDLPPPPDELVIQEKTVALVHNEFFWSNVETIPVKDISQINYSHIPFLATLVITGNGGQTLKISGVPQQQAMKAKNIIEGLQLEKAGEVQAAPASQPDKRRAQLAREGKTRLSAPPTDNG